jgi:cell division protein ZapD
MPSYEFPFNERTRTLLRLEDLFKKVLFHVDAATKINHQSALMLLLQLLEIVERADIKAEIVQELDKQRSVLQNLLGNPNIAEEILNEIILELETAAAALRCDTTKIGHFLRENDWLMSIKQRSILPGGACQFDLPSYHYWLELDETRRKSDFNTWITPLMPIHNGIKSILHILRGSGASIQYTAPNGVYQKMLAGSKPAQMLKIEVLDDLLCFPEVSANKYAINVRFNGMDFVQKPKQCEHEVNFIMTLCNL